MFEKYYRFQKRPEIDEESYSEFISDIFFMLGGEENEWAEWKRDKKEKIIEEFRAKWGFAIDLWWDKHRQTYENGDFEDETEYLIDLIANNDEYSMWIFMMKHKLDGVFAVKADDYPDKQRLMELSQKPELGLYNDYLITFEGQEIEYFGPDYGYLVQPANILSVEKVPPQYLKE